MQRTFFPTFEQQRLTPTDPNVEAVDTPRLKGQIARVLEMLEQGPTTNVQFIAAHILRYSARIFDLRQHGFEITTEPGERGITTYRLER